MKKERKMMKITMENIGKNGQVLFVLIVVVNFFMFLLYWLLETETLMTLTFNELGSLISAPAFFLYLHLKKEDA